jgi:hypothetical protein
MLNARINEVGISEIASALRLRTAEMGSAVYEANTYPDGKLHAFELNSYHFQVNSNKEFFAQEVPIKNYIDWFVTSFIFQMVVKQDLPTEKQPLPLHNFITQVLFFVYFHVYF